MTLKWLPSSEMAFSTHDRGPQGAQDDKAPTYSVPTRPLQAIEHPMLVMNVDKALESFGKLTLPQHVRNGRRSRGRAAIN